MTYLVKTSHKAKVSWEVVCLPLQEGGLGIRRLRDSSRVFSLSLIWRLLTNACSLWVAWMRAHMFKEGFFVNDARGSSGSWIWRKLLKHKAQAAEFFKWEVKDGRSVSFWWDHWLDTGQLFHETGDIGPIALGVARNSKVADVVRGNQWSFRRVRNTILRNIVTKIQATPPPHQNQGPDIPLWRYGPDLYKPTFSARHTWNQIRQTSSRVPWHTTIWFPQRVPRYAFIAWLAIKDRLSTGSRMRAWGVHQPCLFCGERDETRDHLFFACPYSFTIWSGLTCRLLHRKLNPDWNRTLNSLTSSQLSHQDKCLLRLAFQTTIYMLWRERNSRLHNQTLLPHNALSRLVDKAIRTRLSSLSLPSTSKLGNLLLRWEEARQG